MSESRDVESSTEQKANEAYRALSDRVVEHLWEIGGVYYDEGNESQVYTDADALIHDLVLDGWQFTLGDVTFGTAGD